jgi:hypothetical protein
MQNFRILLIFQLGILFLASILVTGGCASNSTDTEPGTFQLLGVSANNTALTSNQKASDIVVDAVFKIEFSSSVDTESVQSEIQLRDTDEDTTAVLSLSYEDENSTILVDPEYNLGWKNEYQLTISDAITSAEGATFAGDAYNFETENGEIELVSASLNETNLLSSSNIRGITYDDVTAQFTFSNALDPQNYQSSFQFTPSISTNYALSNDYKTVTVTNASALDYYRHHTISISDNLTAENSFGFDGFEQTFQTGLDSTRKFPQLTEQELLTKIQEQTFKYFWDFAHPQSGLARERNTSGETVTIGGSGFGLMAIIVGVHRGFITRSQAIDRFKKIVTFLGNADRFHGVWSHWMNGSTGEAISFSELDDGGDLVETAFMAQGLITVREFLDSSNAAEDQLIADINILLDGIEWDWHTRGGQNVLYWHWSPNHGWEMNLPIRGYNEALIIYLLAASPGPHSIDAEVYTEGWARSGGIRNGSEYYGYELPVGSDFGGPLFFAHYSFLGLNPQGLSDSYANYWTQNQNHSLINYQHSVRNPNNFVGYSADSWGLTASDDPSGYSAHQPTNDNGTITPTAALSSMPYTPEKSKQAMRHFYYILGDKLWGEYGFYDAFNPTQGWWADSYLAIDQGPIIVNIENYRSGLLWDLFMDAPEVQSALDKLEFTTSN